MTRYNFFQNKLKGQQLLERLQMSEVNFLLLGTDEGIHLLYESNLYIAKELQAYKQDFFFHIQLEKDFDVIKDLRRLLMDADIRYEKAEILTDKILSQV
jgi:hypothetical protein